MSKILAFFKHKVTSHTVAVVLGAASVAAASYASTGHVDAGGVLHALGLGG